MTGGPAGQDDVGPCGHTHAGKHAPARGSESAGDGAVGKGDEAALPPSRRRCPPLSSRPPLSSPPSFGVIALRLLLVVAGICTADPDHRLVGTKHGSASSARSSSWPGPAARAASWLCSIALTAERPGSRPWTLRTSTGQQVHSRCDDGIHGQSVREYSSEGPQYRT